MSEKVVYLDNNATTKVAPEVIEEMMPYLSENYGNPSSIHTFGGMVGRNLSEARERVAQTFNANPTEILFTSCGSESDNSAIMGTLKAYPKKRHIITTKVEHPAVRGLCSHLRRQGYFVSELSVDKNGNLDLRELRDTIRDDTAIVSVMYANNETGVVNPIKEIGEIVKERGSVFHVDAVQAVGKIPLDMDKLPIDLLALSGHKIHAPKGVGALYIRRGTKFHSFIVGGHQERGRRAGTENVPGIIALGKACELAVKHLDEENSRIKSLRDKLQNYILNNIPNTIVNGDIENRLPNTLNISFKYIEGEAILLLLDKLGICASSGSACTSGSLEPSHVLRAMGVPYTAAHGSIRFSFSIYNSEEEVDYVIKHIPPIIEKLRAISPYNENEVGA